MERAKGRRSIVERVIARIAWFVAERPWRALALGLVLFFGLAPGVGRVYQNIKYYIWFEPGDRRIELLDQFEERFGSDLASMVVVHSPSGIFDEDSARLIIELTDRMWKVSETLRVESLSNFPWVHAQGDDLVVEPLIPDDKPLTPELLAERKRVALSHEQIPGFLVSKDGTTAVIYGWLQPTKTGKGKNEYNDFVANARDLQALVKEYQGRTDHTIYVAGLPVTEGYQEVEPPREMQHLMPLILGMCVVLLAVFFRRKAGVLLPFVVVVPSVIATLGVAGWSGIAINPMTITSPNIMVIIAVSCSVHVLFGYFRALDRGVPRKEAARLALEHELVPTFFSCLTIGIGFLSLLSMTIPPMQNLGILVAAGTAVVWLLLCLFLGPLLVLIPIKARRPAGAAPASPAAAEEEHDPEPGPRATRVTALIDRYKVAIIGFWAAVLGLSLYLAFTNTVAFDPIDWYDKRTDIRKSLDFIRDHLGSSENMDVVIESGAKEGIKDPVFLGKVDALSSWLRKQPHVVQVYSLVDILKETNRALFDGDQAQYKLPATRRGVAEEYLLYTMNLPMGKNLNERVTLANDALRMTIFTRLETSPAVLAFVDAVRAKAKELGLEVELTGRQLLVHQVNPEMVSSFMSSMISGSLVIALVLLIYFRSFSLAFFGILLELIPLVLGAGIVFRLLGKGFDMATIATFSIVLGVTVDDTVHFLHGYGKLRRDGHDPRGAVSRLWDMVAAGMLVSQLILAGCFALFLLITFPVLRYLGLQTSIMLVIAFIANVTLSPSLLLLFQRGGRGKEKPPA